MHDKPGVTVVPLPGDPKGDSAVLTEWRTNGYTLLAVYSINGKNVAAFEQGYAS